MKIPLPFFTDTFKGVAAMEQSYCPTIFNTFHRTHQPTKLEEEDKRTENVARIVVITFSRVALIKVM